MDELTLDEEKEPEGKRLVTILYSQHRDLYRVPSMDKPYWLSVEIHPMPMPQTPNDTVYVGSLMTANGIGWRRVHSTGWLVIKPGTHATVPEDDPMVLDYAAFGEKASQPAIVVKT